jgi:hypothetical protein
MQKFQELALRSGQFYTELLKSAWQRGHGIEHDIEVTCLAFTINPHPVLDFMVFVAAMLHSTDHAVLNEEDSSFTKELKLSTSLRSKLELIKLRKEFTETDREIIFNAVMQHGLKTPAKMTMLLQILREADMLANMGLTCVIRGGQFRPDLPAFEVPYIDFNNPASTYSNPCSVLDAVRNTLGYEAQIKLPKAIPIAKERADALRVYIETVKSQLR